MRISDWSSDVCSSDLLATPQILPERFRQPLCTFFIAFAHAALIAIFDRNGQAALTRGMGCGHRPASKVPRQSRLNGHAAVEQWYSASLERLSSCVNS